MYNVLNKRGNAMSKMSPKSECVECGRVFDLRDEKEASEWFSGHDCEEAVN